jgi:hypothetical protein
LVGSAKSSNRAFIDLFGSEIGAGRFLAGEAAVAGDAVETVQFRPGRLRAACVDAVGKLEALRLELHGAYGGQAQRPGQAETDPFLADLVDDAGVAGGERLEQGVGGEKCHLEFLIERQRADAQLFFDLAHEPLTSLDRGLVELDATAAAVVEAYAPQFVGEGLGGDARPLDGQRSEPALEASRIERLRIAAGDGHFVQVHDARMS